MNYKREREYWQSTWENFRKGDRKAFEIIYNQFVDTLFIYGSKITSDKQLLEDAIQDVFIDSYMYGKNLRQPEYLEFYLLRCLRNNIIKKCRENNRFSHPEDPLTHFDLRFFIEEMEIGTNDFEDTSLLLLKQEIKKLDAQKRELLFLRFNSGLSYVEIGKLLHVNPDTAKKKIYRLIKLLQKKFKKISLNLY